MHPRAGIPVDRGGPVRSHAMALAVIWHYWLGLVFFFLSLLVVVGVVVGYLVRVESLKYPRTRR